MKLPRVASSAGTAGLVARTPLPAARRPICPFVASYRPSFRCDQCVASTSGRLLPVRAALAVASPGDSKTSPVQDDRYSQPPAEKKKRLEGDDIPFDIDQWAPGQVHEVKSPAEFKAFVLERSDTRPIIMMCKARACRPCKVFSRTFSRFAEANPEIIFLTVVGDETPALRRMMVLLGVSSTPFFVTYRSGDKIHQHTGNSDEKLQKALDIAYETMDEEAQPAERKKHRSVDEGES